MKSTLGDGGRGRPESREGEGAVSVDSDEPRTRYGWNGVPRSPVEVPGCGEGERGGVRVP